MKQFIRVAGVLVRGREVLAHQAVADGYVYQALPGGHLEPGETTPSCLQREMREEFGIEVAVGRLLYIAEGLFRDGRKPKHEIVFYYWMHLVDPAAEVRSLEEPKITARWLSLDAPMAHLYPRWLEPELRRLDQDSWLSPPRHVIADELNQPQPSWQIRELGLR